MARRTEEPPAARVLVLNAPLPPPYGGIARYLARAVPHLLGLGYDLVLVQPAAAGAASRPDPGGEGAPGRLRVEVAGLPGVGETLLFLARHPASLAPLLVRFVPALLRVPVFAARQVHAFLAWCRAAETALGGERVDLVHAYDSPWLQGAAALWAARRTGARFVLTSFGEVVPHRRELCQHDAVSRPFRPLSRHVLAHADGAASMTEHCRRQVAYLGIDPGRLSTVRLVVGMDPFHPGVDGSALRARHAPAGGPLLLFVGQVRPRKGPQTLIAALPEVLGRHPSARLLIVGPDHGQAGDLRRQAEGLGAARAVELVGPVEDAELPAYYAAADLFLFPTLTPIECLGLSFVQAMFAGRPVIATRIAGAPEVVRDGIDGWLVEPGDPGELAARVNEVLDLPEARRRAMGAAGRARALELFDEGAVLADLERFYAGALGPGREDRGA